MSDLISRQAAIDVVERQYRAHDNDLLELIVHKIAQLPSAEPERKRGKWMHDRDDGLISGYCSECGWESIICETDVAGMSYCPNCGADMRGGEDATD